MTSTTTSAPFFIPQGAPASARTALKLMQRLRHGSLTVHFPNGSHYRFGQADLSGDHPAASIVLKNWNVCAAALKSGDIGFAETYIAGDWTTSSLTDLLKVFLGNRQEVEAVIYGTWIGRFLYRMKHLLNRNTKVNSQKNIQAHYDLGNRFYELWLDGTMNYSSAWFEGDFDKPMVEAQHAKVRRALRMVDLQPGQRLLEIGCGWGALAEKAAVEFGASVTGVTLSHEQLAWAQKRLEGVGAKHVSAAGPSQGAKAPSGGSAAHAVASVGAYDLRLQDYRDIQDAPFDAICSIEMVEAVGREYWPQYFETLSRLLKPGGKACVQSIVIDDRFFDQYVSSTDFIQQYIFPGGCLPCPREFRRQAEAVGLDVVDEFTFGADYAETLKRWREQFLKEKTRVLQAGFDERFMRIWEFYLAYCEAAFAKSSTDVVQYTLRKR